MSFLAQYDSVPPSNAAQRIGLVSQWIRTDPRAFFAELRERRPILRTPAFTFVTRYHDVLSVLERNRQFSVRIYGGKMDAAVGPYMLGRDESVQNYRDKSLMRLMMPLSDLERVRTLASEATKGRLPQQAGEFDIVKNVSRHVPVQLCGDYFGFPGPDVESMLRWSKATQSDFFKNIAGDPSVHAAAVEAGREMKAYLPTLVEQRTEAIKEAPGCEVTTVVDRLVSMSLAGQLPLDPSELINNIAGLLIGAVETTSQAVAQALEQILIRPQIREQAINVAKNEDHETLGKIVREGLRFNPINPLLFRFTESESVLGEGTPYAETVPRGTIIFACTSSAMWDDSVVEYADEFRFDRPSHCYLHFGNDSHECLGKLVGDTMMIELIRILLLRGAASIDGPTGGIDFEGGPFPESYPVRLEAAA